jgi:hypothetical protein
MFHTIKRLPSLFEMGSGFFGCCNQASADFAGRGNFVARIKT